MRAGNERGAILVATMLLLVLLTLLGAGALMSVTVQSKAGGNLARGLGAFYASESGLEVGAGKLSDHFTTELSPYEPDATWITPSTGDGDPFDGATFGADPDHTYTVQYRISNAIDPANPATVPDPYPFTTAEGGQQLIHYSYQYKIEAKSQSNTSTETEATSEIIRVLETPLVQYYLFFDDHLSWHNGPEMDSWGRVHTNGNLYYAAQSDTFFRDYDTAGTLSPNNITAGGDIVVGSFLQQGSAVYPSAVLSTRAADPMYVRVRNRGTAPSPVANPPTSDCEVLASIDSTNRGSEEERFRAGSDYVVRTGVDKVSAVARNSLLRNGAATGAGFYERISKSQTEGVDGIFISVDPGYVQVLVSRLGHGTVDVTNLLAAFQVSGGVPVEIADWPTEVKRRAHDPVGISTQTNPSVVDRAASTVGAGDPITDLVPGSAVYGVETPVNERLYTFHTNGTTTVFHNHDFVAAGPLKTLAYDPTAPDGTNDFDHNPWYPVVLEVQDGREGKPVDFTVVDMQLLQYWFYDYLDYADNNALDETVNTAAHKVLIYVTRSGAGSNTPVAGSGTNALQAIKLIGGQQGRIHNNGVPFGGVTQHTGGSAATRQGAPTFLFRTTVATPEPVYLVGDFNAPQAVGGNDRPGMGSAILSDAVTLISNRWNGEADTFDRTGDAHLGAGTYTPSNTAFNSAFFTGRYDFRSGGSGEEAGIHNFLRFMEGWNSGIDCTVVGCLISLWFSDRAEGPHGGGYYSPPHRIYGWDTGFASFSYWPPYVPSSYSIERSVWQEN